MKEVNIFTKGICVTYIDAWGSKINNNDERTHFFRKIYLSLYSKWLQKGCERVMCERWVGDWTNCSILIPSSFLFSSTSFSFCWAAQLGVLRAHNPLLGAGSLYSILSPTNWTSCHTRLYHCLTPTCFLWTLHLHPIQPVHSQGYNLMHLFLDRRLGRRSICYICPKVNVIAQMEFKVTFYNDAVRHIMQYTTGISPDVILDPFLSWFEFRIYCLLNWWFYQSLRTQPAQRFTQNCREKKSVHAFSDHTNMKRKAKIQIQGLNLSYSSIINIALHLASTINLRLHTLYT